MKNRSYGGTMPESTILLHPSRSCLSLTGLKFEISYVKNHFNPNTTNLTPPHIHNCLEIFLNVSSDASFLVNNCIYPLNYGDVILSMPNDIHVCLFNEAYMHEHFCLWIDFSERTELMELLFKKQKGPLIRLEQEQQAKLIELFFQLDRLCLNNENDLKKTVCLLQILSFLETASLPELPTTRMPPLLQKILDDIHINFSEIHHVNQLTERHFVSQATLSRWFRQYLHTSPREYLESKKLAHAVKLLTEGATVTESCLYAGFPCCSHFIALFKKKFGKTPFQYKKELKPT